MDMFGSQIVHLVTGRDDGTEVVTPVWAVVVDGAPFIRSAYGATAKWYQRVQRTGRLAVADGDGRRPATAEDVQDEAVLARVDDAYRDKYAGEPAALQDVVGPVARAHTMRLHLT